MESHDTTESTPVGPAPGRDAHAAIEALANTEGRRLYHIALRLCGDPEKAEDLVQETFLQALRRWETFEGRSKPTTWLYTIAARLCARLDRPRAGQRGTLASLDDLLPFSEPVSPVTDGIGGGDEETEMRVGQLASGIAALPEAFRMPVILKEIVGLPVTETAQILGIPVGTVKTRLHRARLALRRALTPALPTRPLPPAAFDRQVCLDLLAAKQDALDRGVPFDAGDQTLCDRCRAVFATLDLTSDLCARISAGALPPEVRDRLTGILRRA